MRAHPLGLACFNKSTKETETIAENVSKLTHSHHLGVTGGRLKVELCTNVEILGVLRLESGMGERGLQYVTTEGYLQ